MPPWIACQLLDGIRRLLGRAEREHSLPDRYHFSKPGVLYNGRHPEREVASGPAGEPTASTGDVGVLRHAPLPERAREVITVVPRITRHLVRVHQRPAVRTQAVKGRLPTQYEFEG